MGFNLYDLWVSDVYVMGLGYILGKKGQNFCIGYGFWPIFAVVVMGFKLL